MSYSVLKNNYQKKKQKNKSEKGFWEYSRFQKKESDINEQYLKSRCPTGNFDHNKIENMMYPKKSKEDIILEKYYNSEKLRSDEKLIANNICSKRKREIEIDIEKIKKFGLNAKDINTDEGRIRKLLLVAEKKLIDDDVKMIYYVSQKLNKFIIPDNIYNEYKNLFDEIENKTKDLDKIKLQFNDFHSNMPPLDERGFNSLDSFQKDVIQNINDNVSTIVQAPTSSGKSILTGYLYTKTNMKALVVVPTDILAWQMSSMIGKIVKKDIPIITETYQTSPKRDILIEKIKNCGIVVGTPSYLLDFLPLIDINFDWLVIDEIHMIGNENCYEMETIAKAYSYCKLLALSATIGNVNKLEEWFRNIGFSNIKTVKCEKRFFNLQQYYYNNRKITRIHPLSMVSIDDFKDKSILNKNINITPPDIWDLVMKIDFDCDNNLNPYNYFKKEQRIKLDEVNLYFKNIIDYMVNKLPIEDVVKILDNYKNIDLTDKKEKLINLAFTLKNNNKTPAIIFQTDTFKCLELVKQFSKDVKYLENRKYPNLYKERLKMQSKAKSLEKKKDKMKLNNMGDKKLQKAMMNGNLDMFEGNMDVSLNEPHKDFIFNKHQKFTEYDIKKWNKELSNFFPLNGVEYHYIIDLLWRGVGVYVKGLPDPYLRIVQNLVCDGELAIVFSDKSLVFGVSMPIRTTVITNDNIDSMMYHQMAGRAGRRGLDKEGNVVFINNTWENIKKLSISSIPNIVGQNKYCYGINISTKLSDNNIWEKIKYNSLNNKFDNSIFSDKNIFQQWKFIDTDDKNLNHMMWKLRNTDDCIRYLFLLPFIRKIFGNSNPTSEKSQIDFAHFMLNYTFIKLSDNDYLDELKESLKFNIKKLMNDIKLTVPDNIDRRIFDCIRANKLLYEKDYYLREEIIQFSENIKHIQHYFYHNNEINITRLIGKLLTRMWWIYHSSSPIMN
jgi:superfamily II DNA or RNA helicase